MNTGNEDKIIELIELDDGEDEEHPEELAIAKEEPFTENTHQLGTEETIVNQINLEPTDSLSFFNFIENPTVNEASFTNSSNDPISTSSAKNQSIIEQRNNNSIPSSEVRNDQTVQVNGNHLIADKSPDPLVSRQPNILKVPVIGESKTLVLKVLPPIDPSINSIKSPIAIQTPSKVTTKPTIQTLKQFNNDQTQKTKLIIKPLKPPSNEGQTIKQATNAVSSAKSNTTPINENGCSVKKPNQSTKMCFREGCTKNAIESEEWDNEYCSSECLIKQCKHTFNTWLENRVTKKMKK